MDQIITKKCKICSIEKPSSEYYRNSKIKDGLGRWCIECTQKRYNKYPKIDKNNKICSKCKIEKPLDLFHKNKNMSKGHSCYCKECQRLLSKQERVKEIRSIYKKSDKGKSSNRKYIIRNKTNVLWYSAKQRAMKKGIAFNITEDDIIIPEKCPVLGIPIINGAPKGKCDNSPSIDRIDNSKGYVKGNICVISWRANTIKNKGTLEEHKKIVEYMEKYMPIFKEKS